MSGPSTFETIAEITLSNEAEVRVYEHGWQSWSPAGLYSSIVGADVSPRPHRAAWQTMGFRPERPAPATGFQGEGLLAVVPADGDDPVRSWVAADPSVAVASIRSERFADRLVIASDGPVRELPRTASIEQALAATGEYLASVTEVRPTRSLGPGWCSWYGYGHDVTDAVIDRTLAIVERERLDVQLLLIDDGHQAEIGDWLQSSGRIRSMRDVAARIRDGGRTAGVWTAPFMVGEHSRIARDHPDWLVRDAIAAPQQWGQVNRILDVTHPDAATHLGHVFRAFVAWGYSFFKLDFLYAGAMPGGRHGDADQIAAYRAGLEIVRDAVGDDATILGCGAPLLPSIGLVDAMRVSPDTDRRVEPPDGDMSQPSMRAARAAARARAWMHGRLWVNDPDCIIADPRSEDRETWAAHLDVYGGLAMSGDALDALDTRGLELTRRLLRPSESVPLAGSPDDGSWTQETNHDSEG